MLGLEDFMTIQALVKRGVYVCDIAEQLGVHPKTVSRAVQRGGPPAPRRGGRSSPGCWTGSDRATSWWSPGLTVWRVRLPICSR